MDKLNQSASLNAHDHYNRQKDNDAFTHQENIYYVQSDISGLKGKLKKGSVFNARIVLPISENKYLLRFLGGNYVMESHLDFKRFDEVQVSVEETEPKLMLKILPKPKRSSHEGKMDILV